jgi:hypothetical protein
MTASLCSCILLLSQQIRDSIKSLFPDRDCFTLVRPMHDERALNHLDSLDPSSLRPEFSEVRVGVWTSERARARTPAVWSVGSVYYS